MSNTDGLRDLLNRVHVAVGVASEVVKTVADTLDESAVAVQKGLEHLYDVFVPEEVEKEEPYSETVEVFTTPGRAKKIEAIQNYLYRRGVRNSDWFTNPDAVKDIWVEETYKMVREQLDKIKAAEDAIKNRVDGDRFGNIKDTPTTW